MLRVCILSVILLSCGSEPPAKKEHRQLDATAANDQSKSAAKDDSTFDFPAPEGNHGDFASGFAGVDLNATDLLFASSLCRCVQTYKSKRLEAWVQQPGAVPHALNPDMREGVIKDPQVQLILGLPGALGDLLGDLFVDDAELEGRLISGVQEQLLSGNPGPGDFSKWPGFKFELFPQLSADAGVVDIDAQASRWNLFWSLDGLWAGNGPLAFGSHLAQLQQTALTLSEWKYLFGLDKSSIDQRSYGGLANRLGNNNLAAFDPRQDSAGHGFFSGVYQLNFDRNLSKMDLAIRGQENWSQQKTTTTLVEQSKQWLAAARAFGRLRPTGRSNASKIFSSAGGFIQDDAHTLPLAFLPGLSALLKGPFIHEESRKIYRMNVLENPAAEEANLEELAYLGLALGEWYRQLDGLGVEQLSGKMRQQLSEGRSGIKQALQLTTQTILLQLNDAKGTEEPGKVQALTVLIDAATRVLESPFLNNQIRSLLGEYLSQDFNTFWHSNAEASEVIWQMALMEKLAQLEPQIINDPEYQMVTETLSKEAEAWSDSL